MFRNVPYGIDTRLQTSENLLFPIAIGRQQVFPVIYINGTRQPTTTRENEMHVDSVTDIRTTSLKRPVTATTVCRLDLYFLQNKKTARGKIAPADNRVCVHQREVVVPCITIDTNCVRRSRSRHVPKQLVRPT